MSQRIITAAWSLLTASLEHEPDSHRFWEAVGAAKRRKKKEQQYELVTLIYDSYHK